ncbi:hypothetical protein FRC07_008547 [Ceratobasidium sp. 392]|nr:hypothetical protein FRC07_008547 [Ceratobasidium sp. 392]
MSNRHRPRQQAPTTLIVPPTHSALAPTPTASVFGTNTATELATNALPTQLVFDSSAVTAPLGVATDGNAATISVSPILVGTVADPKSAVPTSTPPSEPSSTPSQASPKSSAKNDLPVAAIIMAIVAAAAIACLFLFLWYRKRARRRGHTRSSSHGADPGPVLRKLGPGYNEKSLADPFSDDHASSTPEDPFADPEKAYAQASHNRSGSDSFLSMSGGGMPRQPYAHHAASASTGSTASSKIRRKEAEEVRNKDLAALNNLVRALDHKERKAEQEGRERRSLPPVELFKAALVR